MSNDIILPSFGSSIGEATIVQWLVAPGDRVEAGQVIAEVETDKAMAELEAPASGIIETILVDAGSEGVETGSVLARLRTGSETGTAEPTKAPEQEQSAAAEVESPAGARATSEPPGMQSAGPRSDRVKASPYARKLANERAIDLVGVSGSGPDGRVVSRDLESVAATASGTSSKTLSSLGYPADSCELVPLSRMRRAIADGLARSMREIPHFSLVVDLDFEAVLAHRAELKASNGSKDAVVPSLNDYLALACARALVDVPEANRSWTGEGIAQHRHANIAVAVAIDDGLVAPVIRAAEALSLSALAAATRDLVRRAQARALKATDLQGATFTVSNLGMMGVRSFNSILSEPQACILSVGAVEARPVVSDGKLVVGHRATVTLTCDHRVVDGAVGARFLVRLAERLKDLPG